jgi:anti-sigma B factor antagonist
MSVISHAPPNTYELRHWDSGAGRPHVLSGSGEFDLQVAPELRSLLSRLIELGTIDLAVDLTAVTFIDSTVLGVLAGALKRVKGEGGSLVLVSTGGCVRRTIDIAGMDRIFTIHPTLVDALAGAKS